jgi:hypothetical protein
MIPQRLRRRAAAALLRVTTFRTLPLALRFFALGVADARARAPAAAATATAADAGASADAGAPGASSCAPRVAPTAPQSDHGTE